MYHDPSIIPALAELERNWRSVREELDALEIASFRDWPERDIYNQGWRVFGLSAFGHRMEENRARCPRTARLLDAIPGVVTGGFSRLAAGTRISPHRGYEGYSGYFLRCHLGVMVPRDADCGLVVNGETRRWEEGKCLLFDDSYEHSAWNDGPGDRIVLLFDLPNPARGGSDASQWSLTPEIMRELAELSGVDPFG